ncbi:MAG TPA: tetratricopeptide repeat protein [Blastocatellia bacterium]|nr:tetratricopeptide repeat protein [Blastocatellia bacterium]
MRERAGREGADAVTALPPRDKRFALLIGVSKYKDPQIPQLIAPANDVDQLADALVKSGAFPKEHVFILSTDKPDQAQPEATIILQTLYNLARAAGPDGLLLFAYSGHGYEVEGQAFLLGSDARIIPQLKWLQRACVAWSDINEIITEANVGQVVMLLDACRNDPTGTGELRAANQATQIYERGLAVRRRPTERRAVFKILATQNGEPAYEDATKRLGFFMSAVVDGLNGKAADPNGTITVAGLWRFVQQEVPSRARRLGKQQRPEAEIEGYDQEHVVIANAPAGPSAIAKADAPGGPAQGARAENPIIVELNDWIAVRKTSSVADLKMFLRRYPNGNFAEEAGSRILDLEEQERGKANAATPQAAPASPGDQTRPAPALSDDLLYIRKGDQLLGQGRPDKAADEYRQAIKLNAGRAVYYGKLGIALYGQGKYKEAEAEYKKALQIESFSPTLFFNLGLALYRQQKFADAEEKFRRAAKLNPNDAAFHTGLGLSLAFRQKWAEAEPEFREAIKLDPINAAYHGNLANVLVQLKKYREAESEYAKAFKLDPANPAYKEKLIQLRQWNQ